MSGHPGSELGIRWARPLPAGGPARSGRRRARAPRLASAAHVEGLLSLCETISARRDVAYKIRVGLSRLELQGCTSSGGANAPDPSGDLVGGGASSGPAVGPSEDLESL